MGGVPDELGRRCPPFEVCSVDLFGPLVVKGLGGFSRKTFKSFGVLFACTSSRAVSIWLAVSYSSQAFLDCLKRQVAVYGVPRKVLSDQGSQLTCAAAELKEWGSFIEGAREAGIEWSFSPAGCPWRNGQAERAIGLAKHCLRRQVEAHELLTYAQLETALMEVASLINRRPLTARLYDDDSYFPVSPADLLLGRISCYRGTCQADQEEVDWPERVRQVEGFVAAWWSRWQEAAFQLFTPRSKWTLRQRNLRVGDVVMLVGEGKLKKGDYRLARVSGLLAGEDGVVRTVKLVLRDRRKRRGAPETREVIMGVQRLCVLLPVEEQQGGVVASS